MIELTHLYSCPRIIAKRALEFEVSVVHTCLFAGILMVVFPNIRSGVAWCRFKVYSVARTCEDTAWRRIHSSRACVMVEVRGEWGVEVLE